jgi:hypothetical protein
MKMHFGFILLLALGAVIDFHIKFRRANMEDKSHEKALMEIVIFRKLRPATLDVLFIGVVVPNLHFIGSSSPGVFTKNRFSEFSPIYKFGEFQW